VEQGYDAVKEGLEGRGTTTGVAERDGVARQGMHNWLRRYLERGMVGLVDRSKRPDTIPTERPPAPRSRYRNSSQRADDQDDAVELRHLDGRDLQPGDRPGQRLGHGQGFEGFNCQPNG